MKKWNNTPSVFNYIFITILVFLQWGLLLIIPAVITVAVTQEETYGLLIMLIPVFAAVNTARKLKKKVAGIRKEMPHADYFLTSSHSIFGLNVEARKIATVGFTKKINKGKVISFKLDDVRDYRAHNPGHTEYSEGTTAAIGGGASGAMQASMANGFAKSGAISKTNASKNAALAKTGLYFVLDDITCPEVFVQMQYNQAEKWFLVLEKLNEGTLDAQPESMLYPPK